jgi:hypothetical protein
MRNKRNQFKSTEVTFRFKGEKAAEIAQTLFIQWLDGGIGERFEDIVYDLNKVDLIHDWNPDTLTFEIEVVPAKESR